MKKLCAVLLCVLMLTESMYTVYANEVNDVNPTTPVDENGEELILDEQLWGETTVQREDGISLFDNSINCRYSLSAYNDYTYVWAYSWVENGYMEYIYTYCEAFYESGTMIGKDADAMEMDKVTACSAIVQVPESPFNLKAYSANSQHVFRRSGYDGINKSLHWSR